jgi:hypothetical protein
VLKYYVVDNGKKKEGYMMKYHLRKQKSNETHHRALVSLLMTVFIVTLTIAYGAYQSEYKISGEARFEPSVD